jgi:hypothetical protein
MSSWPSSDCIVSIDHNITTKNGRQLTTYRDLQYHSPFSPIRGSPTKTMSVSSVRGGCICASSCWTYWKTLSLRKPAQAGKVEKL